MLTTACGAGAEWSPAGSTASSWQRMAKSRRELHGAMDERGRATSTKLEQGEARPREEVDGRTCRAEGRGARAGGEGARRRQSRRRGRNWRGSTGRRAAGGLSARLGRRFGRRRAGASGAAPGHDQFGGERRLGAGDTGQGARLRRGRSGAR